MNATAGDPLDRTGGATAVTRPTAEEMVIIATHDPEATERADHVIHLDDGILVEERANR